MRDSGGVLLESLHQSKTILPGTNMSGSTSGAGGVMALAPRKDATLSRDASSGDNNGTEPSHMRSVGSASSLSSTVYEDDLESPLPSSKTASASSTTVSNKQQANGSSSNNKPPDMGFEASKYFRFAGFGGAGFQSPELHDNNEILPPQSVSPSNQTTHEDTEEEDDIVAPPSLASSTRVRAMNRHPAMVSRRKNSIEMFLSQSPSQALGGGFLKMALDDEHEHPPVPHQPSPPPELALDPREAERNIVKKTSSVAVNQSTTVLPPSYGYLLGHSPPAVDTEDEWSSTSSQEMLSGGASASAYYYSDSQEALHQHQQSYGYDGGAGNYRYTNEAASYGSSTRGPQAQQQSWNASPSPYSGGLAVPSPSYTGGNALPSYAHHHQHQAQPQHQAPMHSYNQQPSHQQQYLGHAQGGSHHRGISPGRPSVYGRAQPMYSSSSSGRMMMESSLPSPHTGVYGQVKQCKFFLQGHCRMGSKCKFAHHTPSHPSASSSPYHHQQQQPQQQQHQLHHSNSFQMAHASPAVSPHHHHRHLQRSHHEYDAMPATPSSYLPRGGTSRQSYRGGNGDMHGQPPSMVPHHHQSHHAMPGQGTNGGGMPPLAPSDEVLMIEDVRGRVFAMSKDQNGCRLLQEQLDFYEERKPLCDVIYHEAMDHLAEMMVDPFGNYLFQKLLERARPLQRLEMVRRVGGHLVAAALNLHGTRSVQKVVEVCATSAQVVELDSDGNESRRVNLPDLIVEALKDDAVRLCIDSNGNHVIQRALQFMKPEYNQFVFDAVAKECTTVGTHRHGCCVLQRCLDAANVQQKREVIAQVEKQAMKLMQDPYGNYVVQYVLDSCTPQEAYGVISKPLGNVFELSIQKFSSNVIEKCLEKAPQAVLKQYVEEITICPKMQKMLQDQFANYVVQRALCVASEEQCMTLVKAIRPHLPSMKNTSGGRRITARILKRFPHMDLSLDLGFGPVGQSDGYAMGGMASQQYASPQYHHQSPPRQDHNQDQQYQFGHAPYGGGMPVMRGDGGESRLPPFRSSSGMGLRLHDNASMMHNGNATHHHNRM